MGHRKDGNIKSKSKRMGSVMDVVSDPNYGKDTRGDFKGTYHMSSTGVKPSSSIGKIYDKDGNEISKPVTDNTVTKENLKEVRKNMDDKIKQIKNYNQYLYHLDKKYQELELFNGMVLVRLKLIPTYKTMNVNGNEEEIFFPLKAIRPSNADPTGRAGVPVDHPYPYTNVGVVVASDNDKLEPGDTIQLTRKAMNFHWSPVEENWDWPIAFYHHSDGMDHKGYVLIREYDIEAKLNERV